MIYHGKTLQNLCSFLVSFDIASKIDAFYTGGKVQVSLISLKFVRPSYPTPCSYIHRTNLNIGLTIHYVEPTGAQWDTGLYKYS